MLLLRSFREQACATWRTRCPPRPSGPGPPIGLRRCIGRRLFVVLQSAIVPASVRALRSCGVRRCDVVNSRRILAASLIARALKRWLAGVPWITSTPQASKCLVFLVTTVAPCTRPVAAMRGSRYSFESAHGSCAACLATSRSTGKIRPRRRAAPCFRASG